MHRIIGDGSGAVNASRGERFVHVHGKRQGRLATYRQKRDAARTPEPFGGEADARGGLFVVQQHAARSLHWDFRLAWRGVLLSWAIPRGPSLDPDEKRLAVRTEDHPVEYADFEGIIPEGNYGAGAVIVWDRGRWTPHEDPDDGLARGKLGFDLEGYKLRGSFALVRTRGGGGKAQWLFFRKRGGTPAEPPGDASVLSGLTVAELRQGPKRAEATRRALARLGAPRRRVSARAVKPMLAEPRERPFSREGWLFEVKYDGYRVLAGKEDGRPLLRSRNGRDLLPAFPDVKSALAALPFDPLLLDGELVVADAEGRPHFEWLQRRAKRTRPPDAARAAVERPATLWVFDLLGFEDFDLRELPLRKRRRLLEPLLPERGPVRLAPSFETRGEQVHAEVERLGLEGVVAKRADAPYRAGRSPLWQKIRALTSDDFVIVGWTPPRGGRRGFGALHLAGFSDGVLVYAGRVGSGFDEGTLTELAPELASLERETPPCRGAPVRGRHHWVEPERVCEVRYKETTRQGLLRQPVFLRLRDDKPPAECRHPAPPHHPEAAPEVPGRPASEVTRERSVAFTNLDKVFWPETELTKGDLVAYYRAIAPWLLPYLRDRPLVLTRYPDGIEGKSFFQKHAPEWAPEWVRTETIWSEHGGREIRYFVCDDLASLLYVANSGAIPLHVWGSRLATLQRPDWCILDLDPKGAPFAHVVEIARALHELCEEIGLPSFVKTSGSEGLHVLVPVGAQLPFEPVRTLAELLGRLVVQRLPEIATLVRRPAARKGRVYVDTLQNGHGRLLVAPFSVRPLPGAPVSMPLRWREVTARLDPRRFHLKNAVTRMKRLGEDPLAPVLRLTPDLGAVLERLERAQGAGASAAR